MSGADAYDLGHRDRLALQGPDTPAFLNRLFTVETLSMAPGTGDRAFLLDPRGRVELAGHLLRVADDAYLFECSPGHGEEVMAKLDLYHFGERFSVGASDFDALVSLQGTSAAAVLAAVGLPAPDGPWDHAAGTLDGVPVRVARVDRAGTSGFDVFCADAEPVLAALVAAGAHSATPVDLEARRVEAGVADHPTEYGPHSNPLEVSGTLGISEGKGCYPGQEVIERTLALGRPPRRLVRLALDGPAEVGTDLATDARSVGSLTSLVTLPDGRHVGLGLVRLKNADTTEPLHCGAAIAHIVHESGV